MYIHVRVPAEPSVCSQAFLCGSCKGSLLAEVVVLQGIMDEENMSVIGIETVASETVAWDQNYMGSETVEVMHQIARMVRDENVVLWEEMERISQAGWIGFRGKDSKGLCKASVEGG